MTSVKLLVLPDGAKKPQSRRMAEGFLGRKADVVGTLDEQDKPIFQIITKDGKLTGYTFSDLDAARQAAD